MIPVQFSCGVVDEVERHLRAVGLGHGDGTVQAYDRRMPTTETDPIGSTSISGS
jgi:hypothetical protein